MPRKSARKLFEDQPPEWTGRKHSLLGRYAKPAAMKLSMFQRPVVLVDGYAGANKYGDTRVGSTLILAEVARSLRKAGKSAVVHACEPVLYDDLISNLDKEIAEGIVIPHKKKHAEALPEILTEIKDWPAVVFLDPQTASQLSLEADIAPWANRSRTDLLGVFMAGQACRIVGQAMHTTSTHEVHPRSFLGENWENATTEDVAYQIFFDQIKRSKNFAGMYPLRKEGRQRDAYGIFGLSHHEDGMWLLSDAIAKDHARLLDTEDQTRSGSQPSLTGLSAAELRHSVAINRLIEIARPIIESKPELASDKLAKELIRQRVGISELFGIYQAKDYTEAANRVRGVKGRGGRNAKGNKH